MPGFLCGWPASGLVARVSIGQCILACLKQGDCNSFSYSRDNELCALVAPTAGHVNPVTGNTTAWQFYVP